MIRERSIAGFVESADCEENSDMRVFVVSIIVGLAVLVVLGSNPPRALAGSPMLKIGCGDCHSGQVQGGSFIFSRFRENEHVLELTLVTSPDDRRVFGSRPTFFHSRMNSGELVEAVMDNVVRSSSGTVVDRREICLKCHDFGRVAGEGTRKPCFQCHAYQAADCDSCHGNPPAVAGYDNIGTRGYIGGIGAHRVHSQKEGYRCYTCHGHTGDGPNHGGSVGRVAVQRRNIDLVFDAGFSFPGGTTMNNGGAAKNTYSSSKSVKCLVGCHNPIIFYPKNETPNLKNAAVWSDTGLTCADCHEDHGLAMSKGATDVLLKTSSHRVDVTKQDDCLVCHQMRSHTTGVVTLVDNDNRSKTISWKRSLTATDTGVFESFCLSCHDGDNNKPFSTGRVPMDVLSSWPPKSHRTSGIIDSNYTCFGPGGAGPGCHNNIHGSPSAKMLVEETTSADMATVCLQCHI